jgi:predicted Zn-dependent peptidase
MFKKITLKNGLRIITVPQAGTQAVTVLVFVGTGSKYEKKDISGISHFLEHLFFRGTKKRPNALQVTEPLDKVGGMFNAFTGEEYTGYFAKVAADKFDLAIDWVSDIYLNSLFPKKDMEKERGVIIEEINMYYDTPMQYVGELWKDALYGDQPAGWDIAGTKETVSSISHKQLLDYKKAQYVAKNTIICVAGNIDEDKAISTAKKYFSKIPVGNPWLKEKVIEKQTAPVCLLHSKKTDQAHFCLGVRTYNIFHPQRFTLDLMSTILGGMMSSRLFYQLRDKLGLTYYVKTDSDSDSDTGYLVTKAGVDTKRVDEAISAVLKEYRKLTEKVVPAVELKKAKENLKGRLSLSLEASDAQAIFYAGQEVLEKNILNPEEIFRRIDKVSGNDILKVARDIFKPEKLNLALIGPFEDKKKFERLLKF